MVSNNVLPVQDDTNYSDLIGKLTSRSNYNMVRKFYISTYINVFLGRFMCLEHRFMISFSTEGVILP